MIGPVMRLERETEARTGCLGQGEDCRYCPECDEKPMKSSEEKGEI